MISGTTSSVAKKKKNDNEATGITNKKPTDNLSPMDKLDSKPTSSDTNIAAGRPTALDIWVPPKKRRRAQIEQVEEIYPVQPNVIHFVTKPRTHVNHTYRDFSSMPPSDGTTAIDVSHDESQISFHMKIFRLLSMKLEQSSSSIEWCTHGRAFRIVNVDRLEGILQGSFGYNRLAKFRKHLFNHGFKLITQGRDAGCYYSEFLLRGLPHLTQYAPQPVERRKLLPDPDNEPDFYEISQLFPLPGDQASLMESARAALAARGVHITNLSPIVPSPPYALSSASEFAQIPVMARNSVNGSSLQQISTLNSLDAASLSAAARMQAMDSNLNRLSEWRSRSLYYGGAGFGGILPTAGLNYSGFNNNLGLGLNSSGFNNNLGLGLNSSGFNNNLGVGLNSSGFNNNLGLSDTFNALTHDVTNERHRSSLGLSQLLADQQSRDRLATYLQYLSSQEADASQSDTSNQQRLG